MARWSNFQRTVLRMLDQSLKVITRVGQNEELNSLHQHVKRLTAKVQEAKKTKQSGVDQQMGRFGIETNANLSANARYAIYALMEHDAHVQGALDEGKHPLQLADWSMLPASDKLKDKNIAEFVNVNMFDAVSERWSKEYHQLTPWKSQRLPEILEMRQAGFAMFFNHMKVVDTKRVFSWMKWLEPTSVDPSGWSLNDNDELVEVKRTYYSNQVFKVLDPVTVKELTLFVRHMKGARYMGRSLLRSMYGPWYRKDQYIRQMLIWAQKAGAPAPYGLFPDDWDANTIDEFTTFIKAVRGTADAEAYGVFPLGEKGEEAIVKFAEAENSEVDRMAAPIDLEDQQMAQAASRQSKMLAGSPGGGKGVSETMSAEEKLAHQATAVDICTQLSRGVNNLKGPVQWLCDENFENIGHYPIVTCTRIDPHEGVREIRELIPAVRSNLVPLVPELRKQVTERFGFKLPKEAFSHGFDDDGKPTHMQPIEQPGTAPPAGAQPEGTPPGKQPDSTISGRPKRDEEQLKAAMAGINPHFSATLNFVKENLFGRLAKGKVTTRNLGSLKRAACPPNVVKRAAFATPVLRSAFESNGATHASERMVRMATDVLWERALETFVTSWERYEKAGVVNSAKKNLIDYDMAGFDLDEFCQEIVELTVDKIGLARRLILEETA